MMLVSPISRLFALDGDARNGAFFPALIAGHAAVAEALSQNSFGIERKLGRPFYAPVALWGGADRARRYRNDNADVDRRPPPGGNTGCGR